MSGSASALTAVSISSSGHTDGLGRRLLAFDRETGAMFERLRLRPELAAYEAAVRQRIEQLEGFADERFAKPRGLERDTPTGELTVVSEFITGSRVADLLDAAEESTTVPGVDAALGFLLETLPALAIFHAGTRSSHGLIEPSRILITASGRVVFLDPAFAGMVERLGMSRTRLWSEFGIAALPCAGPVRLDVTVDLGQLALTTVMLVLGRRVRPDEYPERLPSLLTDVVEVARIRGTDGFARGVQRILQRMLPLPGRRPYTGAEEALADVRRLVHREMGIQTCRQALIAFTRQPDTASPAPDARDPSTDSRIEFPDHPQLELTLVDGAGIETLEIPEDTTATIHLGLGGIGLDVGEPLEVELSLDDDHGVTGVAPLHVPAKTVTGPV